MSVIEYEMQYFVVGQIDDNTLNETDVSKPPSFVCNMKIKHQPILYSRRMYVFSLKHTPTKMC